jgi:hypothetical protein
LLVNDILQHRLESFVTTNGIGEREGTDEDMDETSHNEDKAGRDNADD